MTQMPNGTPNRERTLLAIQQLNSLGIVETEKQLHSIQDYLFEQAKNTNDGFKGIMEIISSNSTIITAIHRIKSNKGAMTEGVDEVTIRKYLEQNYEKTIADIQNSLSQYKANKVRRVWIPKPGKKEMRPLGIPTIIDRIIQECIRMVIEPICEGRFFRHSYGFRPMRSPHHALERLTNIIHSTGYNWVVEGDIRKFFDEVNHRILLKSLWEIGINDKRLLMVIKQMLKAGIMNEIHTNEIGTPQGGILSPILANVYLNRFDRWIYHQWHGFETNYRYKALDFKIAKLRKTNLKPAYLVRYADDWCLVTNTKENAQKWKHVISKYLRSELKLELSEKKTLITNVKRQKVHFVGFEYKVSKRKNTRKGQITKTEPDRKRLLAKYKELKEKARKIRRAKDAKDLLRLINLYNSSFEVSLIIMPLQPM